jgi:HAD superfamily hydrolase (TIGR01509 family)
MLKAILFDFNGVVINDEAIHREITNDLIVGENLRPISTVEYYQFCLGKSDRVCLRELLSYRGRTMTEDYLTRLIQKKAQLYRAKIETLDILPLYPGIRKLLDQIQLYRLAIGLVTGAIRSEVINILEKAELQTYFSVIVAGDDIATSKPQPDGYLFALEQLNRSDSTLQLEPSQCLAIEDTPVGIQVAKQAGMSVVGVAHTYPYHFMQRQANWAIDHLSELDLDRIIVVLARPKVPCL